MKKKALIEELFKEGVFGQAVAYVYMIEFQKCSLPHMHVLVFLKDGEKILAPDNIDSARWAYWQDPDTEPMLFKTVKKCMVHSCGN